MERIRISESELRKMIMENVRRALYEEEGVSDYERFEKSPFDTYEEYAEANDPLAGLDPDYLKNQMYDDAFDRMNTEDAPIEDITDEVTESVLRKIREGANPAWKMKRPGGLK